MFENKRVSKTINMDVPEKGHKDMLEREQEVRELLRDVAVYGTSMI